MNVDSFYVIPQYLWVYDMLESIVWLKVHDVVRAQRMLKYEWNEKEIF